MTNAVSLRAAAWTISAAVWSALIVGAFSMGLRLPEIHVPPKPNDPIEVVTQQAPPPIVETLASQERPADVDGPVVIRDLPVFIESPPAIEATPEGLGAALETAPPRITNPRWLSRPGAREFERFYPARAREREKEGWVTLDCRVRADGAIACVVATETPLGWGFGDAALKIAPSFRLAPRLEDGRPTEGGAVRVDIAFRLDT